MTTNTKIEWCDHTFNPWTGCVKVSPGCDHCYAEGWSKRAGDKVGKWGAGAARVRTTPANWKLPLKWNANAEAFQAAHGRRQRVFCASLADVFDNQVPTSWRMDLFELIAATPNLDWLLLTKRIGNVMSMCSGDSLMFDLICERVWLGATVVNQEEADRDIPKLLAVPAHKRFLSMEPLLGPVNLRSVDISGDEEILPLGATWLGREEYGPRLDWVIAGGESGPKARPMHPDWARSLRDQCAAAGVPFLFKQWGEWWEVDSDSRDEETGDHHQVDVRDREALEFWDAKTDCLLTFDGRSFTPETLPVDTPGRLMTRLGKKAAGRLLDGVEHNGVPV